MTSTASAPDEGATNEFPMSDYAKVTMTYKPGTLTPEKALEVSRAWINLMNALANDVDPNAGEFYKLTDMTYVDDGDDTITLRFGSPAAREAE